MNKEKRTSHGILLRKHTQQLLLLQKEKIILVEHCWIELGTAEQGATSECLNRAILHSS
jgi:hypothetical protein